MLSILNIVIQKSKDMIRNPIPVSEQQNTQPIQNKQMFSKLNDFMLLTTICNNMNCEFFCFR